MLAVVGAHVVVRQQVSKNEEFCIKNEEICMENEEFCIKNVEICTENEEFCTENCAFCSLVGGWLLYGIGQVRFSTDFHRFRLVFTDL